MHQALTLWRYEVSAAMAFRVMTAYIVIGALAVIVIPWALIRLGTDTGLTPNRRW